MTTCTQSEFAGILGKDKSYVTRLKKAGRLVFVQTSEGERVDVEASKALIASTADPAKGAAGSASTKGEGSGRSSTYNDARTRNELAKAQTAELELAVMLGKLVNADEARLFAADLGAVFRAADEQSIEVLVSVLQLGDDGRAVLVDHFENKHNNLADKIAGWGKAE